MSKIPAVKLNNDTAIPILGLGTWKSTGQTAYDIVTSAIKLGYRHFDTAKFYGNEAEVGRAIKDSGLARSEFFVTTKLWPSDFFRAERAFSQSLDRLGLGYVDLYLVHWPAPGMLQKVWHQMEAIYADGNAKAIGVSNHSARQLECILKMADVTPAVNQVSCSPFNYDQELHKFCQDNGVVMEAYSPLTRGSKLGDENLRIIASRYGKTPAQLMLRWCVQKGVPTIPKTTHAGRLAENLDIFDFEISDNDMAELGRLAA